MEPIISANRTQRSSAIVSHTNRMGHQYFAHQGLTRTGKPKYFASRKSEDALKNLPKGYTFGESINDVVTIQRPKPQLISKADLELVRKNILTFHHLKNYRVEAKGKAILIYEPVGMDSIPTMVEKIAPPMFDSLKAALGDRFDAALAKTAKDMGISVRDLKHIDKALAKQRQKRGIEALTRRIQYHAVMRFRLDSHDGHYLVERRCYRGDEHWASLNCGDLGKMLKRYVRHIGKESFFDLA